MEFDNRHGWIDACFSAQLCGPSWVNECIAGFDVVDRNYISHLVPQYDIGSDASFRAVMCVGIDSEGCLDIEEPYSREVSRSHCSRKGGMDEFSVFLRLRPGRYSTASMTVASVLTSFFVVSSMVEMPVSALG